jgi:uncharacterized protein (DUF2236 family)
MPSHDSAGDSQRHTQEMADSDEQVVTPAATAAAAPDPGLFGPESVTWRVHADPFMWVAGVRALYLQALHPLAIRGVAQNSDFRRDPWGRLMRTANYVGTRTYGTTAEAISAGAKVRAVHRRLRGFDPDSETAFRIDDPDLLRWIHCAEIESYLTVVRRAGLALSDGEADQYVAEQRRSAELVGLDPDTVPDTASSLAAYLQRMRPVLRLTPEARDVYDFVAGPPVPAWLAPVRPLIWRPAVWLCFAMLPPWGQELYGARPATDRRVTTVARALRRGILLIPLSVRAGPHVRSARRRHNWKP